MFTAVVQKALPASLPPPSVISRKWLELTLAEPLSCSPVALGNPPAKLMLPVPPVWMTYTAVPTALGPKPGATAIAWSVVLVLIAIAEAYTAEDVVGVEPSVV